MIDKAAVFHFLEGLAQHQGDLRDGARYIVLVFPGIDHHDAQDLLDEWRTVRRGGPRPRAPRRR